MKVAIVTCNADPDNLRVRSLRAAVKSMSGVRPVIIKNSRRGFLRYPQVLWRLWRISRSQRPDVFLLTFRGQELLPFVLWTAGKRPVWFDEFVVPNAYVNEAAHATSLTGRSKQRLARLSFSLYRRWLHRCSAIFAETEEQAELSARTSGMNLSSYVTVPTPDEEISDKSTAQIARLLAPLAEEASS